jgi:hypothetical protein
VRDRSKPQNRRCVGRKVARAEHLFAHYVQHIAPRTAPAATKIVVSHRIIKNCTSMEMNDFSQKLVVVLIGALAGGLASLFVMVLSHVLLPFGKRILLTRWISISNSGHHVGNARFRIHNNGFSTISDATLYISIDFDESDIVKPTPHNAHIKPNCFTALEEDQICWSIKTPTENPPTVSIFVNESHSFSPFRVSGDEIHVPTEEGWPPAAKHLRVVLKRKNYDGTLKLVSADTNARIFRLEIRPDEPSLGSITWVSSPCPWCL